MPRARKISSTLLLHAMCAAGWDVRLAAAKAGLSIDITYNLLYQYKIVWRHGRLAAQVGLSQKEQIAYALGGEAPPPLTTLVYGPIGPIVYVVRRVNTAWTVVPVIDPGMIYQDVQHPETAGVFCDKAAALRMVKWLGDPHGLP